MQRLKAETAEVHRRTEQQMPIFGAEFDLTGYIRLLASFYGYWSPLEKLLSALPATQDFALPLDGRLKSHLLEQDLRRFGVDPSNVALCAHLPRVDSFAHAVGCMYVLEGSTLGSVFIARHLRERFNLQVDNGAAYFNAYGAETGAKWKQFREFVGRATPFICVEDAVAGASDTFERFERWLAAAQLIDCDRDSPLVQRPA
jgi:heme oxygenase